MKELLGKYIQSRLPPRFLLIACGLPSTGKSGATGMVAEATGYPLLRTDLIRRELLKNEDIFEESIASDMGKRMAVYEEMFRRAGEVLDTGKGVLLDATFITQSLRKRAAAIAASRNLPFLILHTVCPDGVAISRILSRTREDYQSNALTEQAYLNNKKMFEEVDLDDLKRSFPTMSVTHIVADTSRDYPDWYVNRVEML